MDCDVGSSVIAKNLFGLTTRYAANLVFDFFFLLECHNHEELPEVLIGDSLSLSLSLYIYICLCVVFLIHSYVCVYVKRFQSNPHYPCLYGLYVCL